MRQSQKASGHAKKSSLERRLREAAIQDQIDAVMDSFDFGSAKKIAGLDFDGKQVEERTMRQAARRVLHGAAAGGGWATGSGFTAIMQEWKSAPGKGSLKISLFYGPSSLLEPHTDYGDDEVREMAIQDPKGRQACPPNP